MTFTYLPRLLCLALTSFVTIYALLGLLVSLGAPLAVRKADGMEPRSGARLLLSLRLLPLTCAVLFVAGLCVPSYLRLEPDIATERAGPASLGAALLGIGWCAFSLLHSLRAVTRSVAFWRQSCRRGRAVRLPGRRSLAWVVEGPEPVLALTGILRSHLIISRPLLNALSRPELRVALRHEDAHERSRDNFKRLLLLLAPDLLPFLPGFKRLEHSWARLIEWAADDRAVSGNSLDSVSLAGALVRLARLGSAPQRLPLTASLLSCNDDLSARVDRLLATTPAAHSRSANPLWALSAGLVLLSVGILASQSVVLDAVHRMLELLMD